MILLMTMSMIIYSYNSVLDYSLEPSVIFGLSSSFKLSLLEAYLSSVCSESGRQSACSQYVDVVVSV